MQINALSPLYLTAPLGPAQPAYVNAAARISASHPPAALLAIIKRIEADAGRKPGRRWGPRPLDIDILDYHGRVINWRDRQPAPGHPRKLTLPHAGLHLRRFVLIPLLAIAPHWRHPVFGTSGRQLLARLPDVQQGSVIGTIHDEWSPALLRGSLGSGPHLAISDKKDY